MHRFALIVFLLLSLVRGAQAQPAEILARYELVAPAAETLHEVALVFGVEHRTGLNYEVIVRVQEASLLTALAPTARLVEADTAAAAQARLRSFSALSSEALRYHSFAGVQTWMRGVESAYPGMAKVIEYGKSTAGHSLLALRLAKSPGTLPALMITAATHGDERITTEVLIGLVDQLLAEYGKSARFTEMVDRHELYFVPVVNPDGFTQTMRHEGSFGDPNRSYPYPGGEGKKPTPSIEALIRYFEQIRPVGSIDFHAYGELVMYPWAYTRDSVEPVARQRFHDLAGRMAATNRYTYGPISEVIYVAPASSADYYFWKWDTVSFGIEVGHEKIPSPSEFPKYVASQTESTWRFIEAF